MNKGDLIEQVAAKIGTKSKAQDVVDGIFASITDALKKKESVQIAGFGSFKVSRRAARKGRNPQTGAEIQIAARNVAKFAPGKALKDAVN